MENQILNTKVVYTKGHSMTDQIKSDEVVLHATNLLTDETYHWIYPKSKLEELSKVDLSSQAHLIAKLMSILTELPEEEQMEYAHVVGYDVAKYINSSKSYKMGSQLGHNAYYVAVEYTPQGDTCCRIMGSANVDTTQESTSTTLAHAVSMSRLQGYIKPHSSGTRYTIMLDKLTPGTRVSGPKVGRNEPCPCGSGKKSKKCCK